MPLFYERVKTATFQFLIDKDCTKLLGWEATKLYLVRRVTLAKSILMTIPSYLMQTTMIPFRVRNTIEKPVHGFIWGSSIERRKVSLVN